MRFRKERQFDWMRLKKVVPDISRPKKSRHFLMHWMSLKLLDNFQICEHSWPCLFHIKLLLSESDVSCLLRVRSVPFISRAKGCIKFVLHSCLVSLSHKVGVFLEEAICYFIYAKFAVMWRLSINTTFRSWGKSHVTCLALGR